MNPTSEILRGELERLFELDDMIALSRELLGFDPRDVGGTGGKGAFARALVDRCAQDQSLEALAEAILISPKGRSAAANVRKVLDGTGGEFAEGTAIGPYTIARKLGEGGLGVVYEALASDGTRVALKVVRPGFARDRSSVQRFLMVTRALKAAEVPGLAPIVDVGETEDGRPWVASVLLEGQTLAARVQHLGAIHLEEARPLFTAVLETLGQLHARGLVHGHVKAENVFLPKAGGPQLLDGGSDRLAARRYSNGAGVVPLFGTAKSLDPAVVRGSDRSPQADLYAVAVMLYEVLAGRPPFVGDSAMDVVAQQLVSEPAAPSTYAPKAWVSPALDDLVLRALSKNPKERFATAAEFLRALDDVASKKSSLAPASPLDKAAFDEAARAFVANPERDAAAETVEQIAAPAHAWAPVVELFEGVASRSTDAGLAKSLWLRVGRIQRIERGDTDAARRAYEAALALDAGDRDAHAGLIDLLRASGDAEALVDALLERAEAESLPELRAHLLEEIAHLYEDKLGSVDGALVAWTQALGDLPERRAYAHEIERLATTQEHWNEVVTTLSEAAAAAEGAPGARLYLQLGRWYASKLSHPDFALECFARALASDPTNDETYAAMQQVYRRGQNWRELIELLERRAGAEANPAKARDHRAEAAEAVLEHLSDGARAEALLGAVVAEDPAHPRATALLETVYARGQRWSDLVRLFERRAESEGGEAKAATLVRAGELLEDQLDDLAGARAQYEKALQADAGSLDAMKGLERLFAREGKHQDLYKILERELEVAATPRQKTSILERMGAIQEEAFGDRDAAIRLFEGIVSLDPAHEGANAALARFYRQAERWDALAETFERHAAGAAQEDRKVELYLRAAETWSGSANSPSRAVALVERALALRPSDPVALELFARLQTSSGDASSAIAVLDRLADTEGRGPKAAELWVRSGRLLAQAGRTAEAEERYKRALDAEADHAGAREALRALFVATGDAGGAVALLERDLATAKGDLAKAKLHVELGMLWHGKLSDPARAKTAFEAALTLDATNSMALVGLGNLAFESGNWVAASHHYEALLGRLGSLPTAEATRVALRAGDAFRANGELDKAERAYLHARGLAPHDREVLERIADSRFEANAFDEAVEHYASLHSRFGAEMEVGERAHVLVRLGGSYVRAGRPEEGLAYLQEGVKLLPHDATPCEELAAAHEALGAWKDAIAALGQALLCAPGANERFDIHVRMGDLAFQKLSDAETALKHYQAATQIRGDARNVLTKLMAIHSQVKAWPELVEVILRIADLVDDPAQLAKYYRTVGSIHLQELKKPEQAIHYYAQALDYDPEADDAFQGLVASHEAVGDFAGLASATKAHIVRVGKNASPEKRAALWEGLGRTLTHHLGDVAGAIDAYEKALVLAPGNDVYMSALASLYDRDPDRYSDKALVMHEALLAKDPARVASYEALYRHHLRRGHVDGAWCVAQSLRCLGHADVEQKEFFKSRRVKSTLAASAAMDGRLWRELVVHPEQDPLLTAIFTTITPVVLQTNAQTLEAYRLGAEQQLDPEREAAPMVQALRYAAWLADVPLPALFRRADDQGGLSYLFTAPPAIGLGQGAFVSLPSHVVGFVAARHLAYLQPGHYVRYLVPSGTGLKSWLLAAIRVAEHAFPVPAEVEAQVAEYQRALDAYLPAELREVLVKLVKSLLESSPSLDLRRWIAAVDKTADRLGLLLSNDLEHAIAVIAASPEESSMVPRDERIRELEVYCASGAYLRLREKLGAALQA